MDTERIDYETRKRMFYEAADAMLVNGIKPTMDGIRQKIGGSYSTLSKIMGEWKRDKAQEKVTQDAPPEAVLSLVGRMAGELWATANAEAQLSLAALRETATAESSELKTELAGIIRTADALQEKVTGLEGAIVDLKTELAGASSALQECQAQLQIAQAQLSQRDHRLEEMKQELSQARDHASRNSLKDEIESLRAQLQLLSEHNSQLSATAQRLAGASKP